MVQTSCYPLLPVQKLTADLIHTYNSSKTHLQRSDVFKDQNIPCPRATERVLEL